MIRLNIVPKKSGSHKRGMSSKKKTHTFSGHTLCQNKSMGSKKRNSYFFGPCIVPKQSLGPPQKIWVPKKGAHTFSEHTLCPKKVLGPTKKICVPKKRNSFFWGAIHCAKQRFFCLNWFSVQTEKKYRQKSTQKYEFLFLEPILFFGTMSGPQKVWIPIFLELILFLGGNPSFFWHHVWPEKVCSFFFGTHTLFCGTQLPLAQCMAPKKYEFFFVWNSFFCLWDPQCMAGKSMSSFFFWELIFFCGTQFVFGTMSGPAKKWVPFFFGTHTFFVGPRFFSALCLARKSMSSALLENF